MDEIDITNKKGELRYTFRDGKIFNAQGKEMSDTDIQEEVEKSKIKKQED